MKRRELIREIATGAQAAGVGWHQLREGGKHELWRCGELTVTIPRHREINEITAGRIMKELEEVLGRGWWR